MSGNSSTTFIEDICASGLLSQAQIGELERNLQPKFLEPLVLARELVRKGWLTSLQANRFLSGKMSALWIGPYLQIDKHGEGRLGKIYRVKHTQTGQVYAIKLIHPNVLPRPELVRRFQRDLQPLTQLEHPNLVHIYEIGQSGGTAYVVMDYVPGSDIARLLTSRERRPVVQACDYIRQAALALQFLQQQGLFRGDLRPGHLLIEPKGVTVRMVDATLAPWAATMPLDPADQTFGDYTAPECDAGQTTIQSDIYSLGCMLYQLLTARLPFPGVTLADKRAKHHQGNPPPIDQLRRDLPAGLAALVQRMIALQPADRPASPSEVAEHLATFTTENADAIDFTLDNLVAMQGSGITLAMRNRPLPLADESVPFAETANHDGPTNEPAGTPAKKPGLTPLQRELLIGGAAVLAAALLVLFILRWRS